MRKIANWLAEYDEFETVDILRSLGLLLVESCDHPEARSVERAIRKDDISALCSWSLSYEGATIEQNRVMRQVLALFQKLEFVGDIEAKRARTLKKFLATEERCAETNRLFRGWREGRVSFRPSHCAVLHGAQRVVSRVLGDCPSISQLGYRFGPGATSSVKKREASIRRKLETKLSCSKELSGAASAFLSEMPALCDSLATASCVDENGGWWSIPLEIVPGKLSYAEKNAEWLRVTITEPTLNTLVQLGYGDEAMSRCKRAGLDLRDQTRNQALACLGSVTGALATLDLSSASDLNAIELSASLLSPDWFEALRRCRTGSIKLPDNSVIELQKMSSMGNGFTFPLESVIFYALALSATEIAYPDGIKSVSVYGDDIIVPVQAVPLLKEVLDLCGFLVNSKKSFDTGPFRESCGADYLSGVDIRPVYVDELLSPAGLFSLANGLYRRGFHRLSARIWAMLHPDVKLWGPDGFGDGVLLGGNPAAYLKPHGRSKGWGGFTFQSWKRVSKTDDRISHDTALPQYSAYRRAVTPVVQGQEAISTWWNGKYVGGGVVQPSLAIPETGYVVVDFDALEASVFATPRFVKAVTYPGVLPEAKKISIYIL